MEALETTQLERIVDLTAKIAKIARKNRNVLIPVFVDRLNRAGYKSRNGWEYTTSILQNIYSKRTDPDDNFELILTTYLAELKGKKELVRKNLEMAQAALVA